MHGIHRTQNDYIFTLSFYLIFPDVFVRMGYVSEDEYEFEETLSRRSNTSLKGDEAFAKKKSGLKKSELDEQLKEYISEWRKNREDEEDEPW